ncbi:1-deoxy-D-xylulose-5-phosphate synthase [bioreactor metagenome]|uniref:1-deoxy-D-xylulose-5-phosphate synthase n=1 Tax=bioreactor metagenome TaxID=1076179 RepID=A0A644XYF1_9ZZZZ
MKMTAKELNIFAAHIRKAALRSMNAFHGGHVGGSMSMAEVMAVLYGEAMKIDPRNPQWEERDWLVVSKGHCGPAVYATFAGRRVVDQVYISAAYAKLNVRMFGCDAGVTASYNGGTHMPIEDMGLMRTITEVTLIEPTDSVMLADLMRQTKDMYGVFYFRTTRKVTDQIFEEGSTFEIGKAALLREGSDVTLITSGYCTPDTMAAADALAGEGISARVLNIFTWKPIDQEAIATAARETGAIVTVENHNIVTGLGSAVAEVLGDTCPVPLHRIGVPDRFGEVGSIDYLKGLFGMTQGDIVRAAKSVLTRKK